MGLRGELERLRSQGAVRVYGKLLAPNDNSKNQVYLGPSLEAVNLLPVLRIEADEDEKTRLKAPLDFYWLTDEGQIAAPEAKLILYPDYPEVRLSGFLKRCSAPPTSLMASRQPDRVLLLGVREDGRILGRVLSPESTPAEEYKARHGSRPGTGVLVELLHAEQDTFSMLATRLSEVSSKGWIRSWRLDSEGRQTECEAPHCGGLTLEAELGIRPNSRSAPDFMGWELKHFAVPSLQRDAIGSKAVTLMTPEPRDGVYHHDFAEFMRRWGYPDKTGKTGREGRRNFGGVHRVSDGPHPTTRLQLVLEGYTSGTKRKADPSGALLLVDADGTCAARWPFVHLLETWSHKHAQAVYVPGEKRTDPSLAYRYGGRVGVARGTDFLLFLDALAKGAVYLDPGVKQLANGKVKKRNQFRSRISDLSALYQAFEEVEVSGYGSRQQAG